MLVVVVVLVVVVILILSSRQSNLIRSDSCAGLSVCLSGWLLAGPPACLSVGLSVRLQETQVGPIELAASLWCYVTQRQTQAET